MSEIYYLRIMLKTVMREDTLLIKLVNLQTCILLEKWDRQYQNIQFIYKYKHTRVPGYY